MGYLSVQLYERQAMWLIIQATKYYYSRLKQGKVLTKECQM